MSQETVGKFLSILRKSKGFTQQTLAEKLGVSSKTVSKWECDEGMPDISLLPALAEIFEISIEELLSGKRSLNNNLNKNQSSKEVITLIFAKSKSKFTSFSLLSIAFAFISIVFSLIFFNINREENLSSIIWALSVIFIIFAVMTQLININIAFTSINFSNENFEDKELVIEYKKSFKNIVFSWSFLVFAIALIGIVMCFICIM